MAISHEKPFGEKASELFEIDKRNILSIISDVKEKSLKQKASINWNNALLPITEYLFGESKDNWRSEFAPLFMGVYDDIGQFWAGTLGLEFDIRNLEGELALQQYTLIFSEYISDTSNNEVKALIQQAFEDGWSIDTMVNRLDLLFEQWKTGSLSPEDFIWMENRSPIWRRELIARTETTRAANLGAKTLFETWGVERKEWLSTMDDRTRDTHKDVNGQIVNINTPFTLSNGIEIMQPGDSSAPLSETAACRCTILPVIPKGGLKGA